MKELSIEEKARAYDEAIKRGLDYIRHTPTTEMVTRQDILEAIFPELKESEDERIRKELIKLMRCMSNTIVENYTTVPISDFVAWLEKQGKLVEHYEDKLDRCACENFNKGYKAAIEHQKEKQGEQKPADKIKPKFHEGEWVILTAGELSTTLHIVKVDINKKLYWFNDNRYLPIVDEECLHLWTIQDAKDGDVLLSSDGSIFIFKEVVDFGCKHYIALATDGTIQVNNNFTHFWESVSGVCPTTKEQRDTLEKALAEAGYEWDAEKKELKKISQRMISAKAKEALYDKPAWSEEDDRILSNILLYVDLVEGFLSVREINRKEAIEWLKSLKDRVFPQNTWKPSDEQITELCRVISGCSYDIEPLAEMAEQLKKLKEE